MIQTLSTKTSFFTNTVSNTIRQLGLKNSYNPSIAECNGSLYIAFRAKAQAPKSPMDAYLLRIDQDKTHTLINLTQEGKEYGIAPVADPKLTVLNQELWVTFNTGWHPIENQLYLWRLTPEIGRPIECLYKERQVVEKNWGFFIHNQQLMALYSIGSGQLLTAPPPAETSTCIHFETISTGLETENLSSYTIGTQPVYANDKYHFIAHKKLSARNKRLYLGKLFSFDVKNSELNTIQPHGHFLIHSLRSIFGSKIKHNKNLISCTYFSGLIARNNKLIASYGINDIDFNIAEVPGDTL